MDCPTNSSVFEDKNFSLVGESVMEWKFRTCFSIGLAMVFPIRWNCVLLVASSLSSNSLCFSFVTFHHSWKAIHSFISFIFISTLWRSLHVHSISYGSAKRGITPLLVALFLFSRIFAIIVTLSFSSVEWSMLLNFNNISLVDSRSIKWM